MRAVVLALLILTGCACQQGVPYYKPVQTDKPVSYFAHRTAKVTTKCLLGNMSGTGVFIGQDQFLTAAHVVNIKGCSYWVDGRSAKLLRLDKARDIALLQVEKSNYHTVKRRHPKWGEPVVCLGWSYQQYVNRAHPLVTRGYVVSKARDRFRVSCSFWKGGSGGGVWTLDGKLLGLSTGVWSGIAPDENITTYAKELP